MARWWAPFLLGLALTGCGDATSSQHGPPPAPKPTVSPCPVHGCCFPQCRIVSG